MGGRVLQGLFPGGKRGFRPPHPPQPDPEGWTSLAPHLRVLYSSPHHYWQRAEC